VNAAFRSERFFIDADRTDPDKVRTLLEKGKFLMLFEEDVLAGCVYIELRGERGYFGLLAVEPQRQRSGIGARLIAAAEQQCRSAGCRFMDLTFRECSPGIARLLPALWICREWSPTLPGRSGRQDPRTPGQNVEAAVSPSR
jgi:GNAT superfamily N-acetyltransferase